jgi:hypothetical protein
MTKPTNPGRLPREKTEVARLRNALEVSIGRSRELSTEVARRCYALERLALEKEEEAVAVAEELRAEVVINEATIKVLADVVRDTMIDLEETRAELSRLRAASGFLRWGEGDIAVFERSKGR